MSILIQCFGSKEETKPSLVISCNMIQEQCERRVAKLWRLNKQLIADSAPLYGRFGLDIMIALVPRPVLGEPVGRQDLQLQIALEAQPFCSAAAGAGPPCRNSCND